jgi:hypothetical protein
MCKSEEKRRYELEVLIDFVVGFCVVSESMSEKEVKSVLYEWEGLLPLGPLSRFFRYPTWAISGYIRQA